MVAFIKGLRVNQFGESLVHHWLELLGKIHLMATCHIEAEEVMVRKRELEKKEDISGVKSYSA